VQRFPVVEFRPSRTIARVYRPVQRGAVVDEKERMGVLLRPSLIVQERRRGRFIRREKSAPALWARYNDGDAIALKAGAERHWRDENIKGTDAELDRESDDNAYRVLHEVVDAVRQPTIWAPVSIAAMLAVLVVLLLIVFAYIRQNGVSLGGPA